jgi:hypothetical protein
MSAPRSGGIGFLKRGHSLATEYLECLLYHNTVSDILVALGLLCEQQPLQIYSSNRDAVQVEGLAVVPKCFVCLAVRVQNDVDNDASATRMISPSSNH